MKATTLNNCNKRQQSASAEEGRKAVRWEGGRAESQATSRLEDAPPQTQTCRQRAAAEDLLSLYLVFYYRDRV